MAATHLPRGGTLSMQIQPSIKRRSLRKGTHSCWECKRRKMRCVVETDARDSVCRGCRHRGSTCISQEVPEEVALRISNAGQVKNAPGTPMSTASRISQAPETTPTSQEHDTSFVSISEESLKKISQHLYAALPSPEDTKKIYGVRPVPDIPVSTLMTMPYTTLFQNDLENVPSLADSVDPQWHPVLIARHMLMLATSLQHYPNAHPEIKGLSETPRIISERLVRLVDHYVISKDQMLGSIEALECVMMQSIYQANLGNLRRSWMITRRALSIAQLMGLDRPDSRAQYQVLDTSRSQNPRVVWRRIVFLDRFLCVMLNLPAACPDSFLDTASPFTLSKGEQLERIHCIVASHVLESSRADVIAHDRQAIQELDSELQKTARALPARWWLIPHLDAAQANSRTIFWNTGRIFAQVLHYNMVYRLHLPFMFHSATDDHTYDHSRTTCINACREILTRFLALRAFNGIESSCRITDFIALMAALTLLLAHLQESSGENSLGHQYHTDRAMIEKVQETMEKVDQLKSDPLSARSADLLRRLMAIDMYEIDGSPVESVSVHPESEGTVDDGNTVSVQVPYFGVVKITRNANHSLSFRHSEMHLPSLTATDHPGPALAMDVDMGIGTSALSTLLLPSQIDSESLLQQDIFPGLAADLDEWAFQGVDLTFFDTILQNTENAVDRENR